MLKHSDIQCAKFVKMGAITPEVSDMEGKTVTTSISIRPADALFLSWATGINASGLFREALSEQMTYRDINRQRLVELVERTVQDGSRDLDELCERTSCLEDLEAILDSQDQPISSSDE
jgi:hypothetical protein